MVTDCPSSSVYLGAFRLVALVEVTDHLKGEDR